MPVCPFCGIVTESAHENQAGCLAALAEEIARLRSVIEHSAPATVPATPPDPDDEDPSEPA